MPIRGVYCNAPESNLLRCLVVEGSDCRSLFMFNFLIFLEPGTSMFAMQSVRRSCFLNAPCNSSNSYVPDTDTV